MYAAYVTVTLLASAVIGVAAVANLIGHDYPKAQADRVGVSRTWIPVLGSLLAAGAAGLLAGFAFPVLGTLAAAGVVLYFLGALGFHLRVHDHQLGGWAFFFSLSVAALAVNLAHHGGWPG